MIFILFSGIFAFLGLPNSILEFFTRYLLYIYGFSFCILVVKKKKIFFFLFSFVGFYVKYRLTCILRMSRVLNLDNFEDVYL